MRARIRMEKSCRLHSRVTTTSYSLKRNVAVGNYYKMNQKLLKFEWRMFCKLFKINELNFFYKITLKQIEVVDCRHLVFTT